LSKVSRSSGSEINCENLTELQTLKGREIEHLAETEKEKLKRKEKETMIVEAEDG
jgi:hypothetical protein